MFATSDHLTTSVASYRRPVPFGLTKNLDPPKSLAFKLLKEFGRQNVVSTCKGEFMTRYFINDREIEAPLDVSSLGRILKQVESSHLPPNMVVRTVQIDGSPVMPHGDTGNPFLAPEELEKSERIEIYTGTLDEIASDSIAEAIAYLDRIQDATPSLAESFRFSPNSEAFEGLRQLCEGFYWLNILMQKLGAGFHVNLEALTVRGVSVPEHHQKFIAILKQLIESQKSGDFVLIADMLEYEILPLVPVWREMLESISQSMKKAQ